MHHPEEHNWICRAQAGDREAFAALVHEYRPSIYRLLYGLTQNAHAAEDLEQEVFLKAWVHLKSFKPGSRFWPWLARIARNTFLNTRRGRRGAARHYPLPDSLAAHDPDPVAALLTEETQAMMEAALDRLPVTSRAAFLLRTRERMPFVGVAQELSLTAATARWHVFRARRLLRQKLKPFLEGRAP
jgi:RNA polymerase sigma-70 factor (ECF subfamily)